MCPQSQGRVTREPVDYTMYSGVNGRSQFKVLAGALVWRFCMALLPMLLLLPRAGLAQPTPLCPPDQTVCDAGDPPSHSPNELVRYMERHRRSSMAAGSFLVGIGSCRLEARVRALAD